MPNRQKDNEKKQTSSSGFLSKAATFTKEKVISVGAAILGGIIGTAILPGIGTAAGAALGAGITEGIKGIASFFFGNDESKQTVAGQSTAPAVSNQSGMNTAEMTEKLGGFRSKPSIAARLAEAPVAAPQGAVAQFNPLFTPVAANNVTAPQANSPYALPKLTMGGATPAA